MLYMTSFIGEDLRFDQLSYNHVDQVRLCPGFKIQGYHGWTFVNDDSLRWVGMDNFISNIFTQALSLFNGNNYTRLALIWINYVAYKCKVIACNGLIKANNTNQKLKIVKNKNFEKFCKNFLKQPLNRNNIEIWLAYAKLEMIIGNIDMTKKILKQVLDMSKMINSRVFLTAVIKAYIELELNLYDETQKSVVTENNKNRVLEIISILADKGKDLPITTSPTVVLSTDIIRCKTYMHNIKNDLISSITSPNVDFNSEEKYKHLIDITFCNAIYDYLINNLQSACNIIESSISSVKSSVIQSNLLEFLMEKLTTDQLLLYKIHTDTCCGSYNTKRQFNIQILNQYPYNLDILSNFANGEMQMHVMGRMRRYFDHVISQSFSSLPWLIAIQQEESRLYMINGQPNETGDKNIDGMSYVDTGISHRIRSIYERATNSPWTRYCIAIWRDYMRFEVSQIKLQLIIKN